MACGEADDRLVPGLSPYIQGKLVLRGRRVVCQWFKPLSSTQEPRCQARLKLALWHPRTPTGSILNSIVVKCKLV